jgi:hypothetical protein
MADDISVRIGLSLGDMRYPIPPDYLHAQLLQDLALMFGKNGYSLSSFNLTSGALPTGRLLGNILLLEELQYDKNIFIRFKAILNRREVLSFRDSEQ